MKDQSIPAHRVSTSTPSPKHSRPLRWINRLLVICLLWLSGVQPGWATTTAPDAQRSQSATITVTNTNDTGPGSLRQAIADANPGDTIVIGVTGTIFLLSGELVIAKNLTIQGPGAEHSALSAEFLSRVLSISSGATVQISGVSIRDGVAASDGGGINNSGRLTLTDSIVSENAVSNSSGNTTGDGIYNTGTLSLVDVIVTNNSGNAINNRGMLLLSNSTVSEHPGFGISNAVGGQLTIASSTVTQNTGVGIDNAGYADVSNSSISENSGGGISNNGGFTLNSSTIYSNTRDQGGGLYNTGNFTATNSTVSGNTAYNYGGGIHNRGNIYIASTTVAENHITYYGGGLYIASGTAYIRNSVIAQNQAVAGHDIFGTVQSQGHNLIGNTNNTTILGTTIGNIIGDPGLGPLADNGGPTLTHALLSDSQAIDGGKPTGCRDGENEFLTTDQRGAVRAVDGNNDGEAICDIGAFEYGGEVGTTPTPTPMPDPVTAPTLTSVSPSEGPAAGGTTITLQGGNFQSGMAVKLDKTACTNVVVNNSSNAMCSTPAHFPAAVDVTVTNPGGQQATLLRGFTYRGSTANLSLPHVIVDSGSAVEIPIQGAGIGGLMAISLTVSYDHSIADLKNVTVGGLTGGWSLISNTVSSGRVQISMANPGAPAQGSGGLALLHFQATGTPGQTSPLTIQGVSLNDGTIPTTTTVGSLIIETLSTLAGEVRYWTEDRPVPGVNLNLTGANSRSGTTDSAGAYSLADIPSGTYTLAPGKSDGVGVDAITSYDAALVLRHSAGVELLSGDAATAADVDGSGSITPMDASYILRKSVRLIDVPFPGVGRIWKFTPASRSYAPLTADQSAQDFTALLIGDVSGNWGSSQTQARTDAEPVRLRLAKVGSDGEDGAILSLFPGPHLIYSLDLSLRPLHERLPQEDAAMPVVTLASSVQGFALSSNSPAPDRFYIALASATPMQTGGDLLVIRWVDGSGKPVIGPGVEVIEARLNEGRTPVIVEAEEPQEEVDIWGKIFLPAVER